MHLYFTLVFSIELHTFHEYLLVRNLPNNQQNISNFLETKTTFKYLLNINHMVLPFFVNKKAVQYFFHLHPFHQSWNSLMETDWKHEVPRDLGAGRKHPMSMHYPSYPCFKLGKDLEPILARQLHQHHWFVLSL